MKRFFDERGEVASSIATRCRFAVGDLLTTPLFGPFDAIFCRNVLIYLEDDVALKLVERLGGALEKDGVLCVARSEVGIARRALPAQTINDVVVFGRTSTAARVSERVLEAGPPSRVRLILRPDDDPDEITSRGLGLLKTGSAIVELTIIGTCDEARIASLAAPLRRLASAARALGGELRATDENTSRVLRGL
jgi:hypothetical protein